MRLDAPGTAAHRLPVHLRYAPSLLIALQGAALAYFEQHSTLDSPWGWVGNVRQMDAIPEEAQRWLQNEFNPRALAAGLRVVSVVVAESIFGKIATQRCERQTTTSAAALGVTYYA